MNWLPSDSTLSELINDLTQDIQQRKIEHQSLLKTFQSEQTQVQAQLLKLIDEQRLKLESNTKSVVSDSQSLIDRYTLEFEQKATELKSIQSQTKEIALYLQTQQDKLEKLKVEQEQRLSAIEQSVNQEVQRSIQDLKTEILSQTSLVIAESNKQLKSEIVKETEQLVMSLVNKQLLDLNTKLKEAFKTQKEQQEQSILPLRDLPVTFLHLKTEFSSLQEKLDLKQQLIEEDYNKQLQQLKSQQTIIIILLGVTALIGWWL